MNSDLLFEVIPTFGHPYIQQLLVVELVPPFDLSAVLYLTKTILCNLYLFQFYFLTANVHGRIYDSGSLAPATCS